MTETQSKEFTTEQITDYLDGTLDGDVMFEFETEIFANPDVEKQLADEVLKRMSQEKPLTSLEQYQQGENFVEKTVGSEGQPTRTKKKSWLSDFITNNFKFAPIRKL